VFGSEKVREGRECGSRPLPGFRSKRPKPQGGPHFLNKILDVRRNRGPNMKWRAHILKGGAGRAPLASPLATTLVCDRNLRGGPGKNSQTPAGADKKFTPSQDAVVEDSSTRQIK